MFLHYGHVNFTNFNTHVATCNHDTIRRFNNFITIVDSFNAFNFAILLAWPFVAINLLYNICLGFINKALPSLMVAFVGAPFMIGAGLILLTISLVTMLTVWMERVPGLVGWL